MAKQGGIEIVHRTLFVVVVRRLDFLEYVGMGTDRALPEDDQATRQDIRAFHRDADGVLLVAARQVIVRSEANALAAMHVHRVVDDRARALGAMVFDDGGNHRRLLAHVQCSSRQHARRIHHVGVAADARQRFFHTLELANGQLELLAHPTICAAGARRQLHPAGGAGRQRNRAPRRQAFH